MQVTDNCDRICISRNIFMGWIRPGYENPHLLVTVLNFIEYRIIVSRIAFDIDG